MIRAALMATFVTAAVSGVLVLFATLIWVIQNVGVPPFAAGLLAALVVGWASIFIWELRSNDGNV